MEDPERLRLKLRLDLRDVNQQIADLEKAMSKDKSDELKEQLVKLQEYRNKLTEQYENITGLDYSQATTLSSKAALEGEKSSTFAWILGIVSGLSVILAYANLIFHSIGLYNLDAFDFFMGNKSRANHNLGQMYVNGIFHDIAYVLFMLGFGSLISFELLRSLLSESRKEAYSLSQTIALVLPSFYLVFITLLPRPERLLVNYYPYFVYLLITSTVFFALSIIGTPNLMGRIASGVCVILFALSSYNAWIIMDSSLSTKFLYDMPYIFAPIVGVGVILTIAYLFKFIKD